MLKRLFLCAVLAAASATTPSHAADVYPQRSIRLIIPFSAGGGADIIARLMSVKLAEGLGQQIVIDNRLGAAAYWGPSLRRG